jgi:hypothetical protein
MKDTTTSPLEGMFIHSGGSRASDKKSRVAEKPREEEIETYTNTRILSDNGDGADEDADEDAEESTEMKHLSKIQFLLQTLNNTIAQKSKRLDAIDSVCEALDHDNSELHDLELQLGAPNVLFQKLVFVMSINNISLSERRDPTAAGEMSTYLGLESDAQARYNVDDEMAMLCCALEMIYHASKDQVRQSMDEIGNVMLPILTRFLNFLVQEITSASAVSGRKTQLQDEERGDIASRESTANTEEQDPPNASQYMIIQSIIKIFSSFAKAGDPMSRRHMVHQSYLLPTIVRIMFWRRKNKVIGYDIVSEIVADALATIGFLAEDHEECNSHVILTLLDHKGLFDLVLSAATKDRSSRVRTQASFALMHLVTAPKSRFSESQQSELLYTLLALLDDNKKGPKKYAGATLFNLAYSQEYDMQLVTHQQGAFLTALERIVTTDKDKKSRSNAAWVVFYLVKGKPSVAQRVAEQTSLLNSLADVVRGDDSLVKVPAAKALRRLSEMISSDMACHEVLLAALVKAAECG